MPEIAQVDMQERALAVARLEQQHFDGHRLGSSLTAQGKVDCWQYDEPVGSMPLPVKLADEAD